MGYCLVCSTYCSNNDKCCSDCPKKVQSLISLLDQIRIILESSGFCVDAKTVNWWNSCQVASNCVEWMQKMKKLEKEQKERISSLEELEEEQKERTEELENVITYLREVVGVLREESEADVELKAAEERTPITAHTGLLAKNSRIIKNMLDLDGCISISNQQIPFPELSNEELECLVEFLYTSQLAEEKFEKHIYALSKAAHKYEIPFLAKVCEKKLLKSLNTQNVLEALEISKLCSVPTLMERAVDMIVENMEDFVNSAKYEEFAHSNPDLNLVITKAFVGRKRP